MCPECGQPLVAFELDGVEIDHCVSCLGTWLDAGELELIAELTGCETGGLTQALLDAHVSSRSERQCPRCHRRMRVVLVGGADGKSVELDRCPASHGLWFDRGEMKAVIVANASNAGGAEAGASEECQIAKFFGDLYRSELELNTSGKGEA